MLALMSFDELGDIDKSFTTILNEPVPDAFEKVNTSGVLLSAKRNRNAFTKLYIS